jgi:hypothetical protein
MKQLYDITPPPELVQQWRNGGPSYAIANNAYEHYIATQAAQWGADQELEACCDHMRDHQWGFVERPDGTKIHRAIYLQQSRRPKPPSLKERALALISDDGLKPGEQLLSVHLELDSIEIIRRALEQLDD